jgi:hypothetical protein
LAKKLLAIVAFVLLCFGSVVFAAQNSNSSTTQMNGNMGNNMRMRGRRHHRRDRHKKHRRHRHGRMGNKNANM